MHARDTRRPSVLVSVHFELSMAPRDRCFGRLEQSGAVELPRPV
jgi:hypothetical protein